MVALILVINAGILWVLVSVMGGEAKFASLLSVSTYAFSTGILLQLAGLAVLMLKGPGGVTGMEDLQPALGLDLLAPGAKGFTLAFLRGINPFRSEEHTSELQSRPHLVCRLLLDKNNNRSLPLN